MEARVQAPQVLPSDEQHPTMEHIRDTTAAMTAEQVATSEAKMEDTHAAAQAPMSQALSYDDQHPATEHDWDAATAMTVEPVAASLATTQGTDATVEAGMNNEAPGIAASTRPDATPQRPTSTEATCPEATPSTAEAGKRLQLFTNEVLIKCRTPLLDPPKQKPPVRRQRSKPRSTRLAAQKLAHIPPSKRGEVLLQQKMGVPPPLPLITTASSKACKALITGNLDDSQIAAFDELFLAARYIAGRGPRCSAVAGA